MEAIAALRKHSGIFALLAARTLFFSWSTAARSQSGMALCPWGCAPVTREDQMHLMCCRVARAAVSQAL